MKSLCTIIKGWGLTWIRLWNLLQSHHILVLIEPMLSRLVVDSNLIPVCPAKCSTEWLEQWKQGHPRFFYGILVKGIVSQIQVNECPAEKSILNLANHLIHHCTGKRKWSISILYLVDIYNILLKNISVFAPFVWGIYPGSREISIAEPVVSFVIWSCPQDPII